MTDLEYRCVHGHDKCSEMYPGPDCPYCERIVSRMTDLKQERALIDELYAGDKGLFYWNDEDTRRITKALAAARREGAEEMRERAALEIDCGVTDYCKAMFLRGDKCSLSVCPHEMAEGIRALLLTPEEPP